MRARKSTSSVLRITKPASERAIVSSRGLPARAPVVVADSPDVYLNAAGFDFVRAVPTVWDETRFLAGDIDEYVVVARRKGKEWYVGAMGNEQARGISHKEALPGRKHLDMGSRV